MIGDIQLGTDASRPIIVGTEASETRSLGFNSQHRFEPWEVFRRVVNPGDVFLGDREVGTAAEEDAVARQRHRVLRRLLEPEPDMS